ncbi:undecaprenyldiphospho-muramoylpentapeptide beta-N-acetylglucosaminyltransferase [Candidatus Venteria ishoeyi]|uniref:undecaprenyldiphospho-muramoylpentapeptide beta-N-acetylglucosaminyltransferase n=1 Tax=Candidatus Venteria ishoeyi TaxID=1899563 RepID=UPI0025A587AD|nr:undecaprenyldiphospho-muramoylpentapeptide beta-N-acetylglucosaminyltransferase [Candidatus Venteria ishoeyi]MDM8546663.1 undecaprenyldiphospho-muramoylpentapeptide beta-N-acetylglucosaminyltransferase [Candidatus Venteria ishoeyi]
MSQQANSPASHTSNTNSTRPVLIMAGGTGGHVFPALACATALKGKGIPVHWLGTRKGLESRVVPNAGLDISYISISGLRGKSRWTQIFAPFRLLYAIYQAGWVMAKVQPGAVLGMGGFASGPGGIAAWMLGIPLLIHEQNAIPGLTNRILARFAKRVMEAFPGTFAKKYQALHTGNPLRFDILSINPPSPRPLHSPLRLLVLGGSLGAQALNMTLPQAVQKMKNPVQLWHQTGRQGSVMRREQHDDRVEPFIENMAAAYRWADIIVCRAGAMTVSEVAQAGLPAIFIPFPFAVDDHQTANAKFLVDEGAALLIQQTDLNADKLANLLDELCAQPERLQHMSATARALARPKAVSKVIKTCLGVRKQ